LTDRTKEECLDIEVREEIREIARAVRGAGGRALVVGGSVRDRLLDLSSKDLDVEVFGLDLPGLEALLRGFGSAVRVGRSFDVVRMKGLDVDFSVAPEGCDDYVSAARRRDLTINSMAVDPLTSEILDPHGGRRDLAAGRLRACDPVLFGSDPLRALRVAQFAARFEMQPDPELLTLCAAQDLSAIPGERLFGEFRKLLMKGHRPSLGLDLLARTDLLRFFPQLAALVGTPQDPHWHPEGDVWLHTLMVVDEAARLRASDAEASDESRERELTLMFAALCHDFGKPLSTLEEEGRIKSPGHDKDGVAPTEAFLQRLRAPKRLTERVAALVRHHLAPALFVKNGAGAKGYRRLARKLSEAGTSIEELVRVARADHLGRTTPDALRREFPAGEEFLARASELRVQESAHPDVVQGRDLIARGLKPGPHFATVLRSCRELQDELGEVEADVLLDRVLKNDASK